MTNGEKYKNAKEREDAFREYCKSHNDDTCCYERSCIHCGFVWLDLEAADEKPLPCPFCGRELDASKVGNTKSYSIYCNCGYHAPWKGTKQEAIAAHNRVARAVMAANEKEAK